MPRYLLQGLNSSGFSIGREQDSKWAFEEEHLLRRPHRHHPKLLLGVPHPWRVVLALKALEVSKRLSQFLPAGRDEDLVVVARSGWSFESLIVHSLKAWDHNVRMLG
jgi:hypothetical protein